MNPLLKLVLSIVVPALVYAGFLVLKLFARPHNREVSDTNPPTDSHGK